MNQFQMPGKSRYRRCEVMLYLDDYGVNQDLVRRWCKCIVATSGLYSGARG